MSLCVLGGAFLSMEKVIRSSPGELSLGLLTAVRSSCSVKGTTDST